MADLAGGLLEDFIPVVKFRGIRSNQNMEFGTSATVVLPATTTIGGSAVVALGDITSNSTTATAFTVTNTGIFTGTAVVALTANSLTSGSLLALTANGANTGVIASIISTGTLTTTGSLLTLTANSATTAAGLLRINGNALTDGKALIIASSATAMTSTGRLLHVSHTGATSTSGILTEFSSAANDETVIVKITASDINAAGTALQVSTAATTGNGITVTANALTDGFGISVTSSNTTLSSTGRLLNISHSGNAGVSAVIAEVKSAAADETVVFQALASAALAAGKVVNISGASVSTGDLLSVADGDALTSGRLAHFKSNSADVSARNLVTIHNDNAAAVGAVPLLITNDSEVTTHFKLMITLGTIKVFISDQTTPNGVLSAAEGSICLNGSATGQCFYNNDGTTSWVVMSA